MRTTCEECGKPNTKCDCSDNQACIHCKSKVGTAFSPEMNIVCRKCYDKGKW